MKKIKHFFSFVIELMRNKMHNTIKLHSWLLINLIIPCAITAVFWSTITDLIQVWLNNEDFSYGLLIVPVVVYLIWLKRENLRNIQVHSDWRGIWVLAIGLALFVLGGSGHGFTSTRLAMVLYILGAAWLLYGMEVMRIIFVPLLFLFLMIPIPSFIMANITLPLQLISSAGAVKLLNILGIVVYREGNIINLGSVKFQVVEACSGLRYILPLLILSAFFAYFFQKTLWKKIVLILSAIPVAIAANILRIVGAGLTAEYLDPQMAKNFFHFFSGWIVFMFSFAILGLINMALKLLPQSHRPTKQEARDIPTHTRSTVSRRVSWQAVAVVFVFIFFVQASSSILGGISSRPLTKSFDAFPRQHNGWIGVNSQMDPEVWGKVGGSQYCLIDYSMNGLPPINFYVVYYEIQRTDGHLMHIPRHCLVGAGWEILHSKVRRIPLNNNQAAWANELSFNELILEKDGQREIVYYWFQGRGRIFSSEYKRKLYDIIDGFIQRRSDGALVRLISPLLPTEQLITARERLDPMAQWVAETLTEFLPN